MKFFENQYYHFFNRTNNEESLFRSRDNYLFFLKKYRYYLDKYFDTIAYCLMPTHFHFLIRVKEFENHTVSQLETEDNSTEMISSKIISKNIGVLLSSYTKAFNKKYLRHGSLFQKHSKSKLIEDENYFISLIFYIHQNPVRSELTQKPEDWEFSSYQDYINLRNGNLPNKELIYSKFTIDDIRIITDTLIEKPTG